MKKLPKTFKIQPTIFVDESGNTGTKSIKNKEHLYFIIGFCYSKKPHILNRKLLDLLLKLKHSGIYPKQVEELKFYPNPTLEKFGYSKKEIKNYWEPKYHKIRSEISKVIVNNSDGVFAGIINKSVANCKNHTAAKIADSVFEISLMDHVLLACHAEHPKIIYDNRQSPGKATVFNERMMKSVQRKFPISSDNADMVTTFESKDSKKISGIWAGDFVAGAFYHKFEHGDTAYADALASRFIGKGFATINKII